MTPSAISIRRGQPTDAPAVRQFVRDAYAEWVPLLGREPLPMQADYDLAMRAHLVDLVYVAGQLVGLIEMIHRPDDLFIENIAVDASHRGRGLGRFLLLRAEDLAQSLQLDRLSLLTSQLMQSNIRLYRSAGFQIDRTEPFMGGTTVYMSKAVTPAASEAVV